MSNLEEKLLSLELSIKKRFNLLEERIQNIENIEYQLSDKIITFGEIAKIKK